MQQACQRSRIKNLEEDFLFGKEKQKSQSERFFHLSEEIAKSEEELKQALEAYDSEKKKGASSEALNQAFERAKSSLME